MLMVNEDDDKVAGVVRVQSATLRSRRVAVVAAVMMLAAGHATALATLLFV